MTTGRGKGLFTALKFFRHLPYGVVVGGLECTFGGSREGSHLVVGHIVIVAQTEDKLLLGRKAQDSPLELLLGSVGIEVLISGESLQEVERVAFVGGGECMFLFVTALLEEVQSFVEGDAL